MEKKKLTFLFGEKNSSPIGFIYPEDFPRTNLWRPKESTLSARLRGLFEVRQADRQTNIEL